MGETGPCGYCSEIFYDQGPEVAGGPPGSAEENGDRFLEFWNLVFMQFEQVDKATRVDLPKPSIDTGMGLERIACDSPGQARQLRHRPVPPHHRGERGADRHGRAAAPRGPRTR